MNTYLRARAAHSDALVGSDEAYDAYRECTRLDGAVCQLKALLDKAMRRCADQGEDPSTDAEVQALTAEIDELNDAFDVWTERVRMAVGEDIFDANQRALLTLAQSAISLPLFAVSIVEPTMDSPGMESEAPESPSDTAESYGQGGRIFRG
jgi:hypothetical protein